MQKQREHWGTQLGFVLAAAGSAIGLGTLWKIPYVTGMNGGGLFVLIYIACTLFIGIPLFMTELMLGRRAQRGAVGVFATLANNSTFWKGIGWMGVITSFLIMTYYSVIAGWGMNYVLMSLNQFYLNRTPQEISQVFDTLAASGDITIFWHFAFTALTLGVVWGGVRGGIEYWSKIMTTLLLVILLGMFFYCMTLPGFGQAVDFIFRPDPSRFKPSGVLEALGLSFFTLSLGQGIMLTYGSYMRRTDDIPKTGLVIGSMIIIVGLIAALTIFPIIFSFGVPPEAGPGLVFKTLPLLFAKLPGAMLLSVLFFTLFVFTALTSSIALVEVVAANFIDLYGWSRKKSVLIVGAACFICGIPSALSGTHTLFANWASLYGKNFFETVDSLVNFWLIPIGGLFIAIYAGWLFDYAAAEDEFKAGSTFKWFFRPWLFFVRWVVPVGIILILLQMTGVINIDSMFGQPAIAATKP